MKNKSLRNVFLAIGLALVVGYATGTTAGIGSLTFFRLYHLFGTLFLNALSLVVVPLVASSIITGIAKISRESSFGRLGLKTFGFYALTNLCAILVGLSLVALFSPGLSHDGASSFANSIDLGALKTQLMKDPWQPIEEVILRIIPSNIVATAAQGQMLGLIVFSILYGFFISTVDGQFATIQIGFWQGVFQVMIRITHLVMKALPFGVFCLVAKVTASTGLESIRSLGFFFSTVLAGLLFFTFVVLPLLMKFIGNMNPILHFRAMAPALVTAFTTSSSAASLPIAIDCLEKRAGISNRISSLVVPLGTSCNLSGTTLYNCVAVIFIAQVYGYPITFATYFIIGLMALLASLGTAGIPSASLVVIVMILQTIGLPGDGIGLIIATERLLDMCRTFTNVFSNSCCAALVARSEGERPLFYAYPCLEKNM